jgi:hypothetical protein
MIEILLRMELICHDGFTSLIFTKLKRPDDG